MLDTDATGGSVGPLVYMFYKYFFFFKFIFLRSESLFIVDVIFFNRPRRRAKKKLMCTGMRL